MTWNEYQRLMLGKLEQLKQVDAYTRTAVNNVWRESQMRIFTDGKKSDNSQIGTYKNEAYKAFKQKKYGTGNKVDLVATSQFRSAYSWGYQNGEYVIGFIDAKRNKGGSNPVIKKAQEERYGVIFDMTGQEYQNALKAIQFRISEIING